MPILKIKKNGVWEDVAGTSGHTHTTNDITNFPTSLPANGGNADTLGGLTAEKFATVEQLNRELEGLATEDYVDSAIAAIPTPDVSGQISAHNVATDAHNDIRLFIEELTTRLNTLANSDDTTLDQMSEIVAYIKSNKSLIDSITTSKVNTADIINNLTTNVATKPLSAAQGVALKSMVDAKAAKSDLTGLATESYVQAQIQAAIANLMTREQMEAYVNEAILGGAW